MKGLVNFFILLTIVFFSFSGVVFSQDNKCVEIILDASGSMNERVEGEAKIDTAKRVLINLIESWKQEGLSDMEVGLRVYGHEFDTQGSKQKACNASELLLPIEKLDVEKIKKAIEPIEAKGYTPIALSLKLSQNDFKIGQDNMVILISDGKETCGGDPCGIAKQLHDSGIKLKVEVVGFDISSADKRELECIARVSGGKLYSAKDAQSLTDSLRKISKDIREKEEYKAAGKKVNPSEWISRAPEVEQGDYKEKIAMQATHFYKVKVCKGQEVKAVGVVKKTPYEAMNSVNNQTFYIKLFDNDFEEVAKGDYVVKGNPQAPVSFKASWTADETGWVYIAVSASKNHDDDENPVSLYPEDAKPAPSSYTLKVKIKGDIPSGEEQKAFTVYQVKDKKGGSSFDTADSINPGEVCNNVIYIKETRFYKVPVNPGIEDIEVTAVVLKSWYRAYNSDINMKYTLKIYDEDWVEVASDEVIIRKNPASPVSVDVDADVDGNDEMYLSLTSSANLSRWGLDSGKEDEVSVYPEGYNPEPEEYSILVTTE